MANSCKYYTEKTLAWMLNNKIIVFLSLLCFCLFVSTWALAAQKNRALSRIDELNAQLATTTTTTTTQAPVPDPVDPETDGNGETGGNGGTEDNGGNGDNGGTEDNGGNGDNGGTEDNGGTVDNGGTGGTDGTGGTGGTRQNDESAQIDVTAESGDGGSGLTSRKLNAAINEYEAAENHEEMDDILESGDLNDNNNEHPSDLRSKVLKSKLLTALAA